MKKILIVNFLLMFCVTFSLSQNTRFTLIEPIYSFLPPISMDDDMDVDNIFFGDIGVRYKKIDFDKPLYFIYDGFIGYEKAYMQDDNLRLFSSTSIGIRPILTRSFFNLEKNRFWSFHVGTTLSGRPLSKDMVYNSEWVPAKRKLHYFQSHLFLGISLTRDIFTINNKDKSSSNSLMLGVDLPVFVNSSLTRLQDSRGDIRFLITYNQNLFRSALTKSSAALTEDYTSFDTFLKPIVNKYPIRENLSGSFYLQYQHKLPLDSVRIDKQLEKYELSNCYSLSLGYNIHYYLGKNKRYINAIISDSLNLSEVREVISRNYDFGIFGGLSVEYGNYNLSDSQHLQFISEFNLSGKIGLEVSIARTERLKNDTWHYLYVGIAHHLIGEHKAYGATNVDLKSFRSGIAPTYFLGYSYQKLLSLEISLTTFRDLDKKTILTPQIGIGLGF